MTQPLTAPGSRLGERAATRDRGPVAKGPRRGQTTDPRREPQARLDLTRQLLPAGLGQSFRQT